MTREEAEIEIEGYLFRGRTSLIAEVPNLALEGIIRGLEVYCHPEYLTQGKGESEGYGYGDGHGWGPGNSCGYGEGIYGLGFGTGVWSGRGRSCGSWGKG